MSGILPGTGRDEIRALRYREVYQSNRYNANKSSVVQSMSGKSCDSVISGQSYNSTLQLGNRMLTAQQFYHQQSIQESSQLHAETAPSRPPPSVAESSLFGGISQASLFKQPQPVRKFNYWQNIQRRLDLTLKALRDIDDKRTLKFAMTVIETSVHSLLNSPFPQPVNPLNMMDYIANCVKEEYFSKRIPKSICGSSIISDQSNVEQNGMYSDRVIQLDRPSTSSVPSEPKNVLHDFTEASSYRGLHEGHPSRPVQAMSSDCSSVTVVPNSRTRRLLETSTVSTAHSKTNRTVRSEALTGILTDNEISHNLFSDSVIAQKRDEAAARRLSACSSGELYSKKNDKSQAKTISKQKSKVTAEVPATVAKKSSSYRTKKLDPVSHEGAFEQSRSVLPLDGTIAGVSRRGRPLKAPVKYWNSKGDETTYNGSTVYKESNESLLDESMTLRNSKVVEKKITPPIRKTNKKNSPLSTLPENRTTETSANKKSRGRPPGKTSETDTPLSTIVENKTTVASANKKPRGKPSGKENKSVEKKKPAKKQTETSVVKNVSSKAQTNKKKEKIITENKEKATRKPASKRKSKDSNEVAPKKKKIDENIFVNSVSFEENEDIFGNVNYKKPTHKGLHMVLSPNSGLMSAKKAAGEAQGKATPPCKAISDLMNISVQSAMSSVKEAPKQNEAVKRIIKKIERDQMKPTQQQKSKPMLKKTKKDDFQLEKMMREAGMSTYNTTTPVASAVLSCFSGNESESEMEDSDSEDHDDDLM